MKAAKTGIQHFLVRHKRSYIIFFFLFFIGFVFALIIERKSIPEEEIKIYMQDFLLGVRDTGTDSAEIFRLSMQHHIRFMIYTLISSVTIIGVPLIGGSVLWKGFSYGTVIFGLMRTIGVKTIGIFVSVILPHMLFSLPAYFMLLEFSAVHAYELFLGKRDYKSILLKTCGVLALFFIMTCVSAWIQAYGEPLFLSWISNFTI